MLWKKYIILPVILGFSFLIVTIFAIEPPKIFPINSIYNIPKGAGLNVIASNLFDQGIIKSPFLFKSFSVIFGGTKGIKAGDYSLNNRQNVIALAYRFRTGDFELIPVKITVPEGLNIFEISKLLSKNFSNIKEESFIDLVKNEEGYLFPDTYYFLPNTTSEEVIQVLKDNFQKQIQTLKLEIDNFGMPLEDIIKMASIVEEEANTSESRQIVAGILWKRLSLGIPLQVDASFKYINGKTTINLTLSDLKIDSPYNSYLYKGLPPTPISNPGLDSIKASITPKQTMYLYFLTDKKGEMHYAKTYQEHLRNKELYLK